MFYTIIGIAKSTLFSLYYNRVGKITESRVCKLFCVNLAKTRAVLPTTLKQDFKHILDFEFNPSIHKSIKFFLKQEQYNIRRIQNETVLTCINLLWRKNVKKKELTGSSIGVFEKKPRLPETIGNHTRNKKCPT